MEMRREPRSNFFDSNAVPRKQFAAGIWRKELLSGNRLATSLTGFDKDSQLCDTASASEQVAYVISGLVELLVEGRRHLAGEGCSYLIRSGQPYSAHALEDTLVLNGRCCRVPPAGAGDTRSVGDNAFIRSNEVSGVEMVPGFWRHTLVHGEELMLVLCALREGGPLPEHSHPHEQASYVISGALDLTVAGQRNLMRAGCSAFMYGDQMHSARALEDTVSIDIFSPPRLDYLPE